jgi:hypothetical protein
MSRKSERARVHALSASCLVCEGCRGCGGCHVSETWTGRIGSCCKLRGKVRGSPVAQPGAPSGPTTVGRLACSFNIGGGVAGRLAQSVGRLRLSRPPQPGAVRMNAKLFDLMSITRANGTYLAPFRRSGTSACEGWRESAATGSPAPFVSPGLRPPPLTSLRRAPHDSTPDTAVACGKGARSPFAAKPLK